MVMGMGMAVGRVRDGNGIRAGNGYGHGPPSLDTLWILFGHYFPHGKNETCPRGRKFEADFRYKTSFFSP